jgi:hypothetical protein
MYPRKALLAALSLACLAGCDAGPDQEVFGAWRVDPKETQLPKTPFPRLKERIKQAVSNTTLKLQPDHQFVFVSGQSYKGAWSLKGDTVTLVPKVQPKDKPLPEGFEKLEFQLDRAAKTLSFKQETAVGPVTVVLFKSG